MTRILTLRIFDKNANKIRTVKNFNATENSEFVIANVLYEGKMKSSIDDVLFITPYYSVDYYVFKVENGELLVENTEHYNPEVLIEGINTDLVKQYYNELVNQSCKTMKVPEAYKFLKAPCDNDLPKKTIKGTRYYNYRVFPGFIKDVLKHPSKYSEKSVEICNLVYKGLSDNEINNVDFGMEIVRFPAKYQPRGISAERESFNAWRVKCELDGQIIEYLANYDLKGISKFGPVGNIELVGSLVCCYFYSCLHPDWLKYTETDMTFKINTTVNLLNNYLYNKRGSDYRERQGRERDCRIKSADEFLVDMSEALQMGRTEDDRRLTKDIIYEVINYFKSHTDEIEKYEKEDSQSRDFYTWLKGRISQNKNLFKNVPKD